MATLPPRVFSRRLPFARSRADALLTRASIAALTLVAAGCGDSTAPRKVFTVEISATHVDAPVIDHTEDDLPTIQCSVTLRAVGSGDGSAWWRGADVNWYAGTDRSTPFDTSAVAQSEVRSAWNKDAIGPGQTQESTWTFTAGAPFTVSMAFYYEPVDGDETTADVQFSCGPSTPAGTAAPVITDLRAGAVEGELEPSDTLTVDFTATSTVGLWQTAVVLTGPCQLQQFFAEDLRTSVTRSVPIVIPAGCRLGVPLDVAVLARDAGLQTGSKALQTNVSLVDKTPPSLSALFFPPSGSGMINDLAGTFFGGDSIQVAAFPLDNHELSELVWEVLPAGVGIGDSLELNGAGSSPTIFVHLPIEASGPMQIRLHARDAMGLESEAITTTAGAVLVAPTVDRPTASARVDGQTQGAIADTKRGVVYLLQPNARRISVLSLATMTVTGTISLPSSASDFDNTASGDSLVVVLPSEGALAVVDLRQSPSQTTVIPLTLLDPEKKQYPMHVRVLSNGKAFVSLYGSVISAFVLIEVDLATGAQRLRADAGEDGYVGGGLLGRSLDHSVIAVNGGPTYFQRYDVATDQFGTRRSASIYDLTPVVDATGQYVAVGLDVYDGSLQHLRRVSSPIGLNGSVPTALSPDGQILYQLLSGTGLVRSRVSDGSILDRAHNPISGLQMWISDDGASIVTAGGELESPSNISTIDVR